MTESNPSTIPFSTTFERLLGTRPRTTRALGPVRPLQRASLTGGLFPLSLAVMLCVLLAFGLLVPSVQAQTTQSVVRNLHLVGPDGTPLETEEAGPGEKRYHLEADTETLRIAFDCTGEAEGPVQIRLIQPPGTPLFVEDATCTTAETQVMEFTSPSGPLADNEYIVNIYVGDTETFVADSLQLAVGEAQIMDREGEITTPIPQTTPGQAELTVDEVQAAPSEPEASGGPSPLLLALAGAGILGLLAVVAWAGWSAMKA